jgi:hypothetical protein
MLPSANTLRRSRAIACSVLHSTRFTLLRCGRERDLQLVELECVRFLSVVGGHRLVAIQNIGDESVPLVLGQVACPFDKGGQPESNKRLAGLEVPGLVVRANVIGRIKTSQLRAASAFNGAIQ